jgi:hypothetical protein
MFVHVRLHYFIFNTHHLFNLPDNFDFGLYIDNCLFSHLDGAPSQRLKVLSTLTRANAKFGCSSQ